MPLDHQGIEEVFRSLSQQFSGIAGCALVSPEGKLLESSLGGSIPKERVGLVSAALVSVATKATQELRQGTFQETYVAGADGCIVSTTVGPQALLIIMGKVDSPLSLILAARNSATRLKSMV
ncbi:MAG: roadblock/LC7 domain-containing protein [Candidatus Methylomirabilales bacterium]